MKGPGRLLIFERDPTGHFGATASRTIDVPEGLYDVAWSETNPDVLAGALADGTIVLFNVAAGRPTVLPREHQREASCVEWNGVQRDRFLSASYDGTIKIWSAAAAAGRGSLATLWRQEGHVYQASWSPREASVILSVGTDRAIRLWDERSPLGPVKVLPDAHDNEILSVDWNKWDPFQFATGSVDLSVRIWDWRMLGAAPTPSTRLRGHHRAVRRVKWSPFSATQLYSVGYDMTLRCWDLQSINPLVGVWEGHTEFVTGVDVSLHDRGPPLIATCAWDQSVHLLRPHHYGGR